MHQEEDDNEKSFRDEWMVQFLHSVTFPDISVNIYIDCTTEVHIVLLAESINSCIQILDKVEKFLRYIDHCVKRDSSSLCENAENNLLITINVYMLYVYVSNSYLGMVTCDVKKFSEQ